MSLKGLEYRTLTVGFHRYGRFRTSAMSNAEGDSFTALLYWRHVAESVVVGMHPVFKKFGNSLGTKYWGR